MDSLEEMLDIPPLQHSTQIGKKTNPVELGKGKLLNYSSHKPRTGDF